MTTDQQQEALVVGTTAHGPAWDGYLARNGEATIYHDPRWGEVMRSSYGNEPTYLTARRGERVVGALQLVWQKSVLWGSRLCSLPYFDASGILADDAEARDALLAEAGKLGETRRTQWVELRQMEPLKDSLPARTDKVTMRLPLPGDSEALWSQIKAKVRTMIRKAQKTGAELIQGRDDLLGDFFEIYVRTMRDLGSPPHSLRFFRRIVETFEEAKIFSVRLDGKPLAASLTLVSGKTFHVPWAGRDMRYNETDINRLMYWSMLKDAADAGLETFDFGRSTVDSGTYAFKKKWGAEPVPLYWHYILPAGRDMPDQRPESSKFKLMVACWKKLPLWAARTLGPRIIGKLS